MRYPKRGCLRTPRLRSREKSPREPFVEPNFSSLAYSLGSYRHSFHEPLNLKEGDCRPENPGVVVVNTNVYAGYPEMTPNKDILVTASPEANPGELLE